MIAGKRRYVLYCAIGVFLFACHTSKKLTQNPVPVTKAQQASESFRLPDEEEHGSYMPKPDICEDEISDTSNKAASAPADSISPHQ